jgi:hypothetical protein
MKRVGKPRVATSFVLMLGLLSWAIPHFERDESFASFLLDSSPWGFLQFDTPCFVPGGQRLFSFGVNKHSDPDCFFVHFSRLDV